ncbi:hypothetical protein CRQ35_09860 [Salmonella enterica]|nr:hypothetical protein [Salmonella enterica]
MNDCPRHYTQKKAAYRSVSLLHKTRFGGFLLLQGDRMNDCHDTIPKRKRLIGQFHLFIKPVSVSWRVFAYQAGEGYRDCRRRQCHHPAIN